MLTKSLVRYRLYKGSVRPGFIDPEDADLLQSATALIDIFENARGANASGATRGELTEEVSLLIEGASQESAILRGLEKLLLDRTKFDAPEDQKLIQWRTQVFDLTARLHGDGPAMATEEDYYAKLEEELGEPIESLRGRLFSDLPAFHPLTAFKSINAAQLLHRYNTSLIQWLLLNADALTLELTKPKAGDLRQLLKYLRFQQLLATITKKTDGCVILNIDGPLNLFQQSKKYGMNLAHFFPAILHQPQWNLKAELAFGKNRNGRLALDESVGIKPESSRFHNYVPREVTMLGKGLAEKAPEWKVTQGGTFLPLEGEVYSFPDFKLTHSSGFSTYIELFHSWHDTQLTVRLQQLAEEKEVILLLGVSRKLSLKPEIAAALQDSACFLRWGFLFSDIPSAKQVLPLLEKLDLS